MPVIDLPPGMHIILRTLRRMIAEAGYPPTARELAARLEVKHQTVLEALGHLERRGWIARKPRSPRAIRILR